jgi:hypothetical protein
MATSQSPTRSVSLQFYEYDAESPKVRCNGLETYTTDNTKVEAKDDGISSFLSTLALWMYTW